MLKDSCAHGDDHLSYIQVPAMGLNVALAGLTCRACSFERHSKPVCWRLSMRAATAV